MCHIRDSTIRIVHAIASPLYTCQRILAIRNRQDLRVSKRKMDERGMRNTIESVALTVLAREGMYCNGGQSSSVQDAGTVNRYTQNCMVNCSLTWDFNNTGLFLHVS